MLDERSKYLRKLAIRCLRGGQRGHIGSTMSLIEIMRVLYDDIAKYDSQIPKLESRDRIILSKGHGCVAQYALLADKGFFPLKELDKFCRKTGILGGHPSHKVAGIEADTGALGHGLSIGIGMALAAKMRHEKHHVFVIMGDGEVNEGSVWEGAMSAAKHKLDNLTVIIDKNKIQSAGLTEDIQPMGNMVGRWAAFGWAAYRVDGHDLGQMAAELRQRYPDKPKCLVASTVKGKGIKFAEGKPEWHHKSNITEEQFLEMEACLD